MNATKIYADSEEKYVKATIVYADTSYFNLLYFDRDFTEGTEVSGEELKKLFANGVLIYLGDNDTYYRPLSLIEDLTKPGRVRVSALVANDSDVPVFITFTSYYEGIEDVD